MPELQQVANELGPRGLVLVTVVTGGNFERARSIAQRVGLTAPVVVADSELQDIYHVDHVPWTVVIGKDGKAVQVVRGGQDGDYFRRLASKYL